MNSCINRKRWWVDGFEAIPQGKARNEKLVFEICFSVGFRLNPSTHHLFYSILIFILKVYKKREKVMGMTGWRQIECKKARKEFTLRYTSPEDIV